MKKVSFKTSFVLLFAVLALMFYTLLILKTEPHIPIVLAIVLVAGVVFKQGVSWEEIEKGMVKGVAAGIVPMLILSLVGMLIGVWMLSGTVPTLLYYGFQLISPEWFAVSALTITLIVSTFSGSSFTTIGTVGVALIGIAAALGVNPALAAGSIICGACFGDKMSPLSDTTNFSSSVAEVNIFDHIRHLMWTTVPALTVTYLVFTFIGRQSGSFSGNQIAEASAVLQSSFSISWLTLLSPLAVIGLAFKKHSTIPVLMVGLLTGLVTAALIQGKADPLLWINTIQNGFEIESGNDIINGILNRGGFQSMMWSISLIFVALAFGGVIQHAGILEALLEKTVEHTKKTSTVIAQTAAACVGINLLTGEQYLSILLPGQAMKHVYEKNGLSRLNLSRTLEDAGTLVNPLVPWGVSGAFFASTLGVPALDFIPYAVLLYLCPIFSLILGFTGIGIKYEQKK